MHLIGELFHAIPLQSELLVPVCHVQPQPGAGRLVLSTRTRMAVSHIPIPTAAHTAQSKMTCKHPTGIRKMNRMQGQAQCQETERGKSS